MSKSAKPKYTKPVVKAFNCPNCGANLAIKAVGLSISVTCGSCHSTIDTNSEELKYLKEAKKFRRVKPDIPLGSRGKLSGKMYECIGFVQKKDGPYYWREYLLYNPYVGYKWLVEVDGHWSIHKRHYVDPNLARRSVISHKDQKFYIFNDGKATVDYVEGEFYWRLKKGDSAYVKDFIAPPYMLSFERAGEEVNCSFGRYIESERVAEIFKLNHRSFPRPQGVGAIQPSPAKERFKEMLKPISTAITAIFVITLLRMIMANNHILFDSHYGHDHRVSGKNAEIITHPFTIKKDGGNIEVRLKSNASNSWLYVDTLLVNEKTGRGIPFHLNSDYYYGYSGGERWTSGSKTESQISFNVPAGRYFLSMRPQAGTWKSSRSTTSFQITVKSDVVLYRNLFIVLAGLLIVPIFLGLRTKSKEQERWSNSDFSGPLGGLGV